MLPPDDVKLWKALENANPWWDGDGVEVRFRRLSFKRPTFGWVYKTLTSDLRRAIVLYGPRQVGKTVLMHQCIQRLLDDGIEPQRILFIAADNPAFTDRPLQSFIDIFVDRFRHDRASRLYVIVDEIQYLKDWSRHLKVLVDTFSAYRFMASGSAASALRRQSAESGAGRFADVLLPPLLFDEYLHLIGEFDDTSSRIAEDIEADRPPDPIAMDELNRHLIDYINFGGFPETALSGGVEVEQRIGVDIVDKVLRRDLPALYGIDNPADLNRFFGTLADHSGEHLTYANLSKATGIAQNTIKKYFDYLEAAFLVQRVTRIDQNARRFVNQTDFKAFLTSPSLRAAIWGPTDERDDQRLGHLVETMVANHLSLVARRDELHFARWRSKSGADREVDFVRMKPLFGKEAVKELIEVKWSDRAFENPKAELAGLLETCGHYGVDRALVLTRNVQGGRKVDGVRLSFRPVAHYCLELASNNWAPA